MKKKKKEELAETHPDLKGLNIGVNEFGEIITNISMEKINDFLDKHVVDKKLNEDEWEEKKHKEEERKTKQPPVQRKKKK